MTSGFGNIAKARGLGSFGARHGTASRAGYGGVAICDDPAEAGRLVWSVTTTDSD